MNSKDQWDTCGRWQMFTELMKEAGTGEQTGGRWDRQQQEKAFSR